MIYIGNDIMIKSKDGVDKASIGFSEKATNYRSLMGEHYIQLSFVFNGLIRFERGDYAIYDNRVFTLRRDYQPVEINSHTLEYTLKLESIEMFFQDIIIFYLNQNLRESQWTLTGTASQFLQIAIDNINAYFNLTVEAEKWKVGITESTEVLNLSFDSQNVFDALTDIAEKFNGEWYPDFILKTINLVNSYEFGDEQDLQGEVSLAEITMSNENDEDYCTRLFAFGSTRNIPKNYRQTEANEVVDAIVQKRLRLPASNGDFIDAVPNMQPKQIIERVKVFEDIYPRRQGTITALRVEEKINDDGTPFFIYFFKDSGLSFSLDYILPGQTLMLQFGDNSFLNGRSFELAYHPSSEEFEIINDTSNLPLIIPNDVLKPRLGDFYTLYNFDISLVGDQYVGEAEQELLEKATAWLTSIREDNATYSCQTAVKHCIMYDIDLEVGQRVKLISLLFKDGYKSSRVRSYTKLLANFYICTYEVGIKPRYSRLGNIDKNIEINKEIADLQFLEAMKLANYATKNVKLLAYLKTALENRTEIDGGMILTTLVRLGHMVGTIWTENSGMNGISTENANDPAFWAGGTFEEAINNLAAIILRMDGSGQLAKGNILWDALGNLIMRGTFESNSEDNRIKIDPIRRAIVFEDSNGVENTYWGFEDAKDGYSRIRFERTAFGGSDTLTADLDTSGVILSTSTHQCILSQKTLEVKSKDGITQFLIDLTPIDGKLRIIKKNLPSSPSGLEIGREWCDENGFSRIVK